MAIEEIGTRTYLALAIELEALQRIASGLVDVTEVIKDLSPRHSPDGLKAYATDHVLYLLSKSSSTSRFLVISLQGESSFAAISPANRLEALDRTARIALGFFEKKLSAIPLGWRPHRTGSRVSFQSNNRNSGESGRLLFEARPKDSAHCYLFGFERAAKIDLASRRVDYGVFKAAIGGIAKLASLAVLPPQAEVPNGISFADAVDEPEMRPLNYLDWYEKRFTSAQRAFVDLPIERPSKIVGPAGSGKTLALIVKILKLIDTSEVRPLRILFLSHGIASAVKIEQLIESIDDKNVLYGGVPNVELEVTTMASLANKKMKFGLHEVLPLSDDGIEGRQLQADVIGTAIDQFRDSDWVAYKATCGEPFQKFMIAEKGDPSRRIFVWELMNEFACVLDAEGVEEYSKKAERYFTEVRRGYMMPLVTKAERKVVFEIYRIYKNLLTEMGTISCDQMTTDYLNDLDGFLWRASRKKSGYDAIFVDELHLFNRQERMVFLPLLKARDAAPSVVMAYDTKQSPRDTFVGISDVLSRNINHWTAANIGAVEKIEVVDVFRHSPEIASAIEYLDEVLPGVDLEEDWPAYSGKSRAKSGQKPRLFQFTTTEDLYNRVFSEAASLQREYGRTKRVAVLCVSEELFTAYLSAGQHKESYVAITSRDDVSSINRYSVKFVFGRPEYVAGLQFDTVFLIEVNADEVPNGPFNKVALRRFVSDVYLGASRAERRLDFFVTKERGGPSPLLNRAQKEGAILLTDMNEL